MWHPALGHIKYSLSELSDDPDTQVSQTIGFMRRYACEDAKSPIIQQDALQAWQSSDPVADTWKYLSRYEGSRGMQFVNDEVTGQPFEDDPAPAFRWRPVVETLMRPCDQAVCPIPQGDCDDFSMYGAAHLIARGVPCSFATIAANQAEPDLYSHVYLVAYPQTGRVVLDLSHGEYLGWEAPALAGKFREWPVIESGFGLLGWAALLGGSYLIYRAASGRVN
jgi:hypothetical protein